MALNNANLLQDNIDLSIDLNILKDANNKYLLDALANLGQRMGVSGDSITISNLSLQNWLETINENVYLSIQYDANETLQLNWYNPTTKEYTPIDDGLDTYMYNKLTYYSLNDILESYNGIINDVINFNSKSYAYIKENYLYSYLFTDTVYNTTHYMYEVIKYNLNTSVIDEYNRLLYLGNDDNNVNIYMYVTIANKILNVYIFNDIYSDESLVDDVLKKEYIDSKVDKSELIEFINTYISYFTSNTNNIIFSTKDDDGIALRLDTETNVNYIIDTAYDTYINDIYTKYLSEYAITINDLIQYVNNYISYLCPDIVKTISYKLYTQSIKVFTKQILLNLYEAVVDSVNANKKYYGMLYLPYDLVISYISKEANIMYPFSSIDIPVYFVSDEITNYDDKIIFKYIITDDDYDITNKVKIFKFYCKYNEYNGVLYSVYFINTIMPYIGSNHLWYVNDKQTDVLASYDNNNSINMCVVEYDLDSSFSSITDIEDIQMHHSSITIITTESNIYSTYLYNNVYIQIPLVSINMHNVNENVMFIGKANVQTASPYSIYFIYVCTHVNGEIYKITPLVNSSNILITINDLVNYTNSNITLLKNNIEELGFTNNVYIIDSLHIEKDTDNIKFYNNTEDTVIDTSTDARTEYSYANTYLNLISGTDSTTTKLYNQNDSNISSNYLYNYYTILASQNSSQYNNAINTEWKIDNSLLENSNILYDNIKAQNKLQVVSFNKTDTCLDYLGQNIVKGYDNEITLSPVPVAEYNNTMFGEGIKSISKTHDTLRAKYNDIILDGRVYTSDLDLDKRYYKNTSYYTSKYNIAGTIDYYMPIDTSTRFRNNNQTPKEMLTRLFSDAVMQARGKEYLKTYSEFLYVYDYRKPTEEQNQIVYVFMNVTKLYNLYNMNNIQNIIINGHYYNSTFSYFLDDKYVSNRYLEQYEGIKYVYLGAYEPDQINKIGLPYVDITCLDTAIDTESGEKMDDTNYNLLANMYFNSNVQATFTKYVTKNDETDTTIYDVHISFDDNENS